MLRKFLDAATGERLSPEEERAIEALVCLHGRLELEDGKINTKTEDGYSACTEFLSALEDTVNIARVPVAPRAYRQTFTTNYKALFPDEVLNYRVDVLEASVEQYAVIWVNGDKFEFSPEAMTKANRLQAAMSDLGSVLSNWATASASRTQRHVKSFLYSSLGPFDTAWASFEQQYISELINIEDKARGLIVQAIDREKRLQRLEAHHAGVVKKAGGGRHTVLTNHEVREQREELAKFLARLNAVANFRRKGRDDLNVNVLEEALATLERCDAAEAEKKANEATSAARSLALDVVESFDALRAYLREVSACLERVDPHLCNNPGLVARLVDWEESWEVGSRYVLRPGMLHGICDVVAQLRGAQRLCPDLQSMIEDCDVQMFLVIPRIIWLRYLQDPEHLEALVSSLLQDRFGTEKTSRNSERLTCQPDGALQDLLAKYQSVEASVSCALPSFTSNLQEARELLVKRSVAGEGHDEVYAGLLPNVRSTVQQEIEAFFLELEKWSMELQRKCPDDWNQCSAVLVQCLNGDDEEKPQQKSFKV